MTLLFFIASPFIPISTLPAHSLSVCSVCALCSPPLWVEALHLCPMWQHPLIFFFHFSCSSHSLLPYQDDLLRIKTKSHKSFIFRGFLFLLQDSVLTFLWLPLKNHAQHIDWAPVTVFFQFLEQTMLPFTSGSLLIVSSPQSPLFFSFQWPNSFSCLVPWLLKDWEINLPFYRFWETRTTRFSLRQECRMNIKEEEEENNWG